MKIKILAIAMSGVMLGACARSSYLDKRYEPERADFGSRVLPVPAEAAPPAANADSSAGQVPATRKVGTWTFTVPATVTQVERKAADYMQYSLFQGRPAPGDTPFLVITVSADSRSLAESDSTNYRILQQREYALNGNLAKEWSGNTKSGAGFSELLIRRPGGTGDVCHAMATVRADDERKLSLEILGSIAWQAGN